MSIISLIILMLLINNVDIILKIFSRQTARNVESQEMTVSLLHNNEKNV